MREADFKDWLSRRRYQGKPLTAKANASRMGWLRNVEKALPALGFSYADLDAVHTAGEWATLLDTLARLRTDWTQNEAAARIIAPESENPAGHIRNARTSASHYGHFADGDDPNYDEDTSSGDKGGMLTDEEILKRFSGKDGFKEWWAGWAEHDRSAFFRVARTLHDAGLDWYHVNLSQEVRCGRRKANAGKADEVFLIISGSGGDGSICKAADRTALVLPEKGHVALAALADALDANTDATKRFAGGTAYWPDEVSPVTVSVSQEAVPTARGMTTEGPTNLILYGPPGTSKTYTTAAEAVRLCGEEVPIKRAELMTKYRELQQKGRIEFVTFHQNFSYEDFVEGLRPVTGGSEGDDSGTGGAGFSLRAQPGIFKLISDLAASNHGKANSKNADTIDPSRKIFKMSLGRSWSAEDDVIYQDAIQHGYVVLGWGGQVDWSDARYESWDAIKERWRQDHPDASGNDPNMSQMYTFRANMQIGSLVVISDGNLKFRAIGEITGPYSFEPGRNGEYNHRRKVQWLWESKESLPRELIYEKELSQVSAYQMNSRHVKWEGLKQIVAGADTEAHRGEPEPFVLVIDEINRANISKVFGELITLLEPDKRLGRENALTVRLPYSKEEFGVPANLHIIGTMNTADRSIALLDTALRRRFVFRELAPDASLLPDNVDGIPLRRVLEVINDRIEYLIDREHRIGHAFFMGSSGNSRDAINRTMRHKVIPLLQEYFFEDWSRIAAVLGEQPEKGGAFLDCRKLDDPTGRDGEPRLSWEVRKEFAEDAYDRLIGRNVAPAAQQTESQADL